MSLITHQGVNYEGTYVPIQSDPSATSLDTYSVPTGGTIENWSNTKKVTISEEDYAALVSAGTVDPNTIYFRPGASTLGPSELSMFKIVEVEADGTKTYQQTANSMYNTLLTSYNNMTPYQFLNMKLVHYPDKTNLKQTIVYDFKRFNPTTGIFVFSSSYCSSATMNTLFWIISSTVSTLYISNVGSSSISVTDKANDTMGSNNIITIYAPTL